jgi:nitrilase
MSIAAVIQMVSTYDVDSNLSAAKDLLQYAAAEKSCLAVLPENFAVFSAKQMIKMGAEESEASGRIRSFIADIAAELNIWIVAGTVPCAARPDGTIINGKIRSACRVYDSSGNERARYDKIHLFDADIDDSHGAYRESDEIEHGDDAVTIETPLGVMGFAVCYDLRFPELFSIIRSKGATVISIPSAFTKITGQAHWEVLSRARAIETQSWVLAANQGGRHSAKKETSGDSMIVDPWGRVIKRIKSGEGVITAEIDENETEKIRRAMPIMQHKRKIF